MNGTAEQHAESAAMSAQRSSQSAKDAASSALECYQAMGRTERESRETRAEVVKLGKEMREGFAALNAAVSHPRPRLHSITEEDFEDSPTGTHKVAKITKRRFEKWTNEREQLADASTYRGVKRRARQLFIAALVGSATFGGEHLLKWLLAHH